MERLKALHNGVFKDYFTLLCTYTHTLLILLAVDSSSQPSPRPYVYASLLIPAESSLGKSKNMPQEKCFFFLKKRKFSIGKYALLKNTLKSNFVSKNKSDYDYFKPKETHFFFFKPTRIHKTKKKRKKKLFYKQKNIIME